ncbi:cytochrome c oxidase accessory protein CcoG [Paramagnetospirillum marisnigri]|uniref:Cytochrome c oxidase accessory protein CcoG n=1 Tax=Paramagnetospirillum marisnigri TaxID=1285242 RepID=A0A178MWS3_9PROT|nr:cytochrome c oxidase accessory protein CcoG [Paramagnetospirillum marisnigri]OAN55196.1 cytochrome c oxidase accessory protein CcoG [Paramagnetospirillum marisnigri]
MSSPKIDPSLKTSSADGDSGSLYAETVMIHPRTVKGTFRTAKWAALVVLLAIYHIGPFLRWDRGPGAPNQAILADMTGRRGYFFFLEIWPQEVYYITGLLFIAAIGLFFMSALAGRVWCGFLCFQTVYTDLFMWVEKLVVGDRAKRMALDRAPWTADKFAKKVVINLVWLVIALSCGVGFTLYFGDAPTMLVKIFTLQEDSGVYWAIGIVGGCCFMLAGYAREQVCLYMCPYSRFQSAMFDHHSLIVTYQDWRGEPRKPARKTESFDNRGHCIDCKMCVTACPTGVDIRDGIQMGCIGCALCIDACNTMMDKYKLPRDLIIWDSEANVEARSKGEPARTRLVRSRTIIYAVLLLAAASLIVGSLASRKTTELKVIHERSPLYVQLSDGAIRNGYVIKVSNMIREDRDYEVEVSGIEGATLSVVGGKSEGAKARLTIPPDSIGTFNLFVTVPSSRLTSNRTSLLFTVREDKDGTVTRSESLFAAPEK